MMAIHNAMVPVWIRHNPSDAGLVDATKLRTKLTNERQKFKLWKDISSLSGATIEYPSGRVQVAPEQEARLRRENPKCGWIFEKGLLDVDLYLNLFTKDHASGLYIWQPGETIRGSDLPPMASDSDDDEPGSDVLRDDNEMDSGTRLEDAEESAEESRLSRRRIATPSARASASSRIPSVATSDGESLRPSRASSRIPNVATSDGESLRPSRRSGKPLTSAEGSVYLGDSLQKAADRLAQGVRPEGSSDIEKALADLERLYKEELSEEDRFRLSCKLSETHGGRLQAVLWNSMPTKALKDIFKARLLAEVD